MIKFVIKMHKTLKQFNHCFILYFDTELINGNDLETQYDKPFHSKTFLNIKIISY